MIHQKLDSGDSFGININAEKTHVLLQLNDSGDGEQVRVRLTADEVDRVIGYLKESKGKIKCSVDGCKGDHAAQGLCIDHYVEWLFQT